MIVNTSAGISRAAQGQAICAYRAARQICESEKSVQSCVMPYHACAGLSKVLVAAGITDAQMLLGCVL